MAKTALDILKTTYGYGAFRSPQAEIIDCVVSGQNAFVLMPTGGGKSLCYQIPSLMRKGVGIIISPLIALMQDQIIALDQLGIRAAAIHSGLSFGQVSDAKRALQEGTIDLLYVAPERLVMPEFLNELDTATIALFAIDEAHCVSQWGHDFRPDYVKLSLLAERFAHVPRIALTATADHPTRKDIVERLHLAQGQQFISGFDRPNIHYRIVARTKAKQQVLDFIQHSYIGQSGIVYCISRKKVDEMAAFLRESGLNALPYHAGLASEIRSANQTQFLREDAVIMVATIAFGMGIDKPDVRFVVHMNTPKNIEAYYQETGRAGRDGLPAQAYMIYGLEDAAQQRQWIEGSDAPDAQKRIEHQKLNALLALCESATCRRQHLLRYFGDEAEPCGNCDSCDNPPSTFNATTAAQKALSCAYRTGQRFGVMYLINVLLGKADDRMQKFGHDAQSTFGIGQEHTKPQWQNIFRQLIAQNLLAVDGAHGGVAISPQGADFLKAKSELHLREMPAKSDSKNSQKSSSKVAAQALPNAAAQSLFEQLKTARAALAKENKVPAYVVFHDKTLIELATQKPNSLDAMMHISGIGQTKLDRYGQPLLDVILAFDEAA